jgi:hypothetical protein
MTNPARPTASYASASKSHHHGGMDTFAAAVVAGLIFMGQSQGAERVDDSTSFSGGQVSSVSEFTALSRAAVARDRLLYALAGLPRPVVYPTADSGFQLEWSTDTHEVSAEVSDTGSIYLHATDVVAITGVEREIASTADLSVAVDWLARRLIA